MALFFGTISFAQNNNNGEAQAVAAARSAIASTCLKGYTSIDVFVTENYNCNIFDGVGVNRTIDFYNIPKCPPNTFCKVYALQIAQVEVDCNNNIVNTVCFEY